jgi:hypothetical protein
MFDIERLVSEPRPSLVVYDKTFDAETEVRKRIQTAFAHQVVFSSVDPGTEFGEKLTVAMQSIVSFLAEDLARESTGVTDTIHLQKNHFERALEVATSGLTDDPVETFKLLDSWQAAATSYLIKELKSTTKREAIFRTCEQFRIDIVDFSKVFPKLPS